ncbi:unnamed protein product (macronuclear) [Paramecium tetraurelia]|uniref:Transmembrane protein n=1 Tax=Paramecium tetraurelia TaxID=5888 RepID=A0DJM2_PARTE|nr:uncharacterized protein GSPATT00017583001 [Paramecium tetraurelia]CAK83239.1 unnamed protein product [Paramecium tetraurelia]|eukprot:XP_001450636.1 hypothetical protein (macronuclear) [Paramecium tetraurelia strain d4-2]
MLGSMGFLLFCIYFVVDGFQGQVFPLDNFQFRFIQWIDCKTKEQVGLVNVQGELQISLLEGQGICLDQNYQLPLDEDSAYKYTFIFNRSLNNDSLFIFIDYKMYDLSKQLTSSPVIQIQHYHFLTCKNSIEFWLNSTASLNLILFFITKVQTTTKDQILLAGSLPQLENENKFYFDFSSTFELILQNQTLQYKAKLQKSYNEQSALYWFRLYQNKYLLPLQISQIDTNNILIQGSRQIVDSSDIKLNNLPFLIKTQYQITQINLISQHLQNLEFEAIIQIDNTFSQLNRNDILLKQKFKPINQVRMQVDVNQNINNTLAVIEVLPKGYECVQNINISEAKITIKNEQQEIVLECYLIESDKNKSCVGYDERYCIFYVEWKFENNIQYSYELSATLEKNNQQDPFVYFQTDLEYFPMINDEGEDFGGYWVGYILLINLLLPILMFLFCVFCVLSLNVYHPYIMYIIELDEIYFKSKKRQQQESQQSMQQDQSSYEGGKLIQQNSS